MVPVGGGFPLAAGNDATCAAQAFIFTTLFGAGGLTNGFMAYACEISVKFQYSGTLCSTLCSKTNMIILVLMIDLLTICRNKPERKLRTKKWKAMFFGYPWLHGIVIAAASRTTFSPNEIPMSWFCWSGFGEPGSPLLTIAGMFGLGVYILMTVLICYSMASLVWVSLI